MQILSLIRNRFEIALTDWVESPADHAQRIAVARDPRHGDYQANIAMPLAKPLGMKPVDIARQLAERLQIEDICHAPEVAGPGFINLRVKDEFLVESLQRMAKHGRLDVGRSEPLTYVIDYSAPNVAKPMHVGHIRSTVIGDALARILRFLGHQVITDNHLGDWGTQFGMIIYGYKNFADHAAFEQQPIAELSRIYRVVQQVIGYQSALSNLREAAERLKQAKEQHEQVDVASDQDSKKKKKELKASTKTLRSAETAVAGLQTKIDAVESCPESLAISQKHPGLEQRAQLETAKLHQGDQENVELWKQFITISIAEIDSVYERLEISFDYTYGESFYHPMLADVVTRLEKDGMAEQSDGAICLFLHGFDAPMIIRKRDGAFLYATTDLATIDYRMEHFEPDAILYVVDHRQSEHFQKLFAAGRSIGYRNVELQHISFGTVLGTDGKPYKTRSGSIVGLNYLLDEAVERAYQVVCNPDRLSRAGLELTDHEQRDVANTVGLGAIKYADLSHNRTSDYKFDIDQMVQLEGDTAAYIQYSYARTRSIIRKSEVDCNEANIGEFQFVLQEPAERDLALQLLQFEDVLRQSVEEYYPSVLTAYLFGVAKQFATFFDQCHVLGAPSEELKRSRLAICYTTGRVVRQGLELLGIGVVEKM